MVEWMEEAARKDLSLTYVERGTLYHKNASELTQEGYFDRFLDAHSKP